MKALVTGSNGFIGSTLTAKLLQEGMQVKCVVRKTSDLTWLKNQPVEFSYADLRDYTTLGQVVKDVDIVFHLAGVTKARDPEGYMQGNLKATENLLSACEQYGSDEIKFVFVSSLAAAGPSAADRPLTEEDKAQPISQYGLSKYLAEQAVLRYAEKKFAVIIRPPVVYGPRDRDVLLYFKSVKKGFLFLLGTGKQRISLVHVDDLVQGIMAAANHPVSGKIFYISGDGAYDWHTIGHTIARALNKKPITIYVPLWLLSIIAAVSVAASSLTGKPALLNWDKVAEMKQAGWMCSNERAKKELGFRPKMDLQRGIQQTADWYQSMGWI